MPASTKMKAKRMQSMVVSIARRGYALGVNGFFPVSMNSIPKVPRTQIIEL